MEGRHKDFNNYLVKSGTIKALTKTFAKLFEMTDDERPENAVWFVQQHMIDNDEVRTVDIIEYEKVLNETKEINVELLENQNNTGDVSKTIDPKDGSNPKKGAGSAGSEADKTSPDSIDNTTSIDPKDGSNQNPPTPNPPTPPTPNPPTPNPPTTNAPTT